MLSDSVGRGGLFLVTASRQREMIRRTFAAMSVLVASFVAVLIVLAGAKVIATATAPVFFGRTPSADRSYPDGTMAIAGTLVVATGVALGWTVLRAQQGSKPHQVFGAAVLLLLALGMASNAGQRTDETRCVTDTYLDTEHCVGRTWGFARQLLSTSVPTTLAAVGLLSIGASRASPARDRPKGCPTE